MRVLAEDGYEKRPRAAPEIQHPAVRAEVILRGQRLRGSGGDGFDALGINLSV